MNNTENTLISIIIPVYNIQKEYLTRCIDSCLHQTHSKLELILVDDGSTDKSADVCDEYASKDPRVKVFHKKNGGSSSARNLGIKNAGGEYFGFVDSDDHIDPRMYETLLSGIREYNVKCAQIGRDETDEEGNRLPDICSPPDKEMLVNSRDFIKELLMHRGDCSFCTKLIAREIFEGEENFFPVGALNEDFHILIKKLPKIGDTVLIPEYGYHVFYRLGSNSRKKDKNDFSRVFGDCVDNADMAQELVKENYPEDMELKKISLRFGVFQRLEYLLHIPTDMMKKPAAGSGADSKYTKNYEQYRAVVKWMRRNYFRALINKYLSAKNKAYHTLFAIAPRGVRLIHKKIKGFD